MSAIPPSLRRGARAGLVVLLAFGAACQRPRRQVTIVGSDYAFRGPDSLPAGPVAISFENQGRVPHELSIARLKPGLTLDSALAAVRAGAAPESVIDGTVGILIAMPGQKSLGALSVDLVAGRTYGLICQFQDAPDRPPHLMLGMVGRIEAR